MLMNRPIKRGCMEVYNDYNSNLTNLFFCVKERPLALITELGFLPLNSRDDFEAIYRQLKCEEFDDEYLAIELELADKYFSPLHAKAIKAMLLKRAQRGNVRRAANYYKLIRYSFSGAGKSFGGKPCNIRNFFADIWRCARRLENVVIENKDFESLMAQYDRPDAFFYCDPPYYNAMLVFEYLEANPIIEIRKTAEALSITFNTASSAIKRLTDAGILVQTTNASRNRTFAYEDYLSILRKGT